MSQPDREKLTKIANLEDFQNSFAFSHIYQDDRIEEATGRLRSSGVEVTSYMFWEEETFWQNIFSDAGKNRSDQMFDSALNAIVFKLTEIEGGFDVSFRVKGVLTEDLVERSKSKMIEDLVTISSGESNESKLNKLIDAHLAAYRYLESGLSSGIELPDTIFVDWHVMAITASNSEIIANANGRSESIEHIPEDGVIVVKDKGGNFWWVDSDGNVTGPSNGIADIPVDSTTIDSTTVALADSLIIDGLSRNADVVAINTITGNFTPGPERMEMTYTIADTLELNHTKIEIFRVNGEDTTLVTFYSDLPKGMEIEFQDPQDEGKKGWSGKGTDGEPVSAGEYQVKLTTAIDESFRNGFEDYEVVEVEEENYITVVADSLTSAADQAVDYGIDFVGNSTSAACNICTRAAVYISTGSGNKVLFPKDGSHLGDTSSPYLKGSINNPGKANNIYDDLKDGFVVQWNFVDDMSGEDYPDFEQLQDDANDGEIIIGTWRNPGSGSGHIVMMVPGDSEPHPNGDTDTEYQLNNGNAIEFPKILECGANHRENLTPAYDNISIAKLKVMRWYKLSF